MAAKSIVLHIHPSRNERDKWALRVLGATPPAFKAQFTVVEANTETPFLFMLQQNRALSVMDTMQYLDKIRQQMAGGPGPGGGGGGGYDSATIASTAAARASLLAAHGGRSAPAGRRSAGAGSAFPRGPGLRPSEEDPIQPFGGFGTAGGMGIGRMRGVDVDTALQSANGIGFDDAGHFASERALHYSRARVMDDLFTSVGMTPGVGAPPKEIVPLKEGHANVDVDAMMAEREARDKHIRATQRNVPMEPPTHEKRMSMMAGGGGRSPAVPAGGGLPPF